MRDRSLIRAVIGGSGFITSSLLLMLEVQERWYHPAVSDIGWWGKCERTAPVMTTGKPGLTLHQSPSGTSSAQWASLSAPRSVTPPHRVWNTSPRWQLGGAAGRFCLEVSRSAGRLRGASRSRRMTRPVLVEVQWEGNVVRALEALVLGEELR